MLYVQCMHIKLNNDAQKYVHLLAIFAHVRYNMNFFLNPTEIDFFSSMSSRAKSTLLQLVIKTTLFG